MGQNEDVSAAVFNLVTIKIFFVFFTKNSLNCDEISVKRGYTLEHFGHPSSLSNKN